MLNYSKIESLINSKDLKKVKVSKAIGLNNSTFDYKMKNHSLSPDDVLKLSDFFNKPLAWFFDREETPMQVVNEQPAVYGCPACKQKDITIGALQQTNQLLIEQNHQLKNRLGEGNTEVIGKAG
jgi:hypothetical protein